MNLQDFNQIIKEKNLRLYVLSILVGFFTGLVVVAYRSTLGVITNLRIDTFSKIAKGDSTLLFMTIIVFFLVAFLLHRLIKRHPLIKGSGLPQVKGLLLMQVEYNWLKELVYKFAGGVMSVGSGLSLGRGGPSIQLGSQVGYAIKKTFKSKNVNQKFLISSGVSAGLSAAFNSPLAGIIFTIEEVHKYLTPVLLICISLASVTAEVVTHTILGRSTLFHFQGIVPNNLGFAEKSIFIFLLSLLISILGVWFTTSVLKFQKFYNGVKCHPILKSLVIFGISIATGIYLLDIQGVGYQLIVKAGATNFSFKFIAFLLIGKLIFTILSNAPGFPGGLFLPTLVLGALSGYLFILGVEAIIPIDGNLHQYFMVLGMAAFFTAVMRSPLTGNVLLLEMTGSFNYLPDLMFVTILTYIFTELIGVRPITNILYDNLTKKTNTEETALSKNTVVFTAPIFSCSWLEGKLVNQVEWPIDSLLIKIQRGDYDIIPNGSTKLIEGDILYILTTTSIEKVFKPLIHDLGKIDITVNND